MLRGILWVIIECSLTDNPTQMAASWQSSCYICIKNCLFMFVSKVFVISFPSYPFEL